LVATVLSRLADVASSAYLRNGLFAAKFGCTVAANGSPEVR
jgi:hypothetical protein